MRLALRELARRPGRFVVATGALSIIALLLLLLGGLADGLFLGSTGAIRAQDADVFVYSADSRDSFLRSRITPELRAEIEAVPGVGDTGGLGVALLGAAVPGESDLADVAVIGYQLVPDGVPEPPPPGQGYADERLQAFGVDGGDVIGVGPEEVPIEIVGFVSDTNYLLQGAVWVDPATWREAQNSSRPDARIADGVFQVLLVRADDGMSPEALADLIDAETGGATSSLTREEAVFSLPGTEQQNSTFSAIIGVTFFVAGLIVALFFALLTIERTGLYGVLKALGASSWRLFAGLVVQAVAVAVIAFLIGGAITVALAAVIPPDIPVLFESSRVVTVAVGLVITAVVGGAISLRRITRIDPASAIGQAA